MATVTESTITGVLVVEPGTMRVAPLSGVKSSSIQTELHTQ